jgi:single-strand DNA-binding protein
MQHRCPETPIRPGYGAVTNLDRVDRLRGAERPEPVGGGGTMNKVMLAGRMTKPVELKALPSGAKVAVGSLASHDYRGGEERTEFHRLVFWEKLAEIAGAHLQAGSLVAIDGRLKTHEWESDGSRRWMTEVIVNRLEFLGPKPAAADAVAQGAEPSDLGEAEYGEEIAPPAKSGR